jgi:class 3 adenylate cyclase
MSMNREIDVRPILPAVRVPTLILHRSGDHNIQVDHARYMAERIDQAKYVELSGEDHLPWVGESDLLLDEVQVFLTGVRRGTDPERVLATLMFTDIVDATARDADLGDKAWRDLLARHYALLRQELKRYRGQEVDTAGDALFATFDGPARAIQCASAMSKAVVRLGLSIRIGLHTGECEVIGDKVTGIAVHIGSRVAGLAGPGEVLVTSTVKDLVAGSGIRFEGRGPHQLKGVPGEWQLYRALR